MDQINIDEFKKLPDKIAEEEIVILQKNKELEALAEQIRVSEEKTRQHVNELSELDEYKKALSNAEKRQIRVNQDLAVNDEYQKASKDKKTLEENKKILEIELASNKRLFRLYESLARIGE